MEASPFFSVIVVSYNAEKNIKKTLDSILSQTFTDYEIIVKDACSTDRTIEQIPALKQIKVYITKDNGVYFGMNEAISYSNGRYLCFLNCGDFFVDSKVLENVYQHLKAEIEDIVAYGDYRRKEVIYSQPSRMTNFNIYRSALCHQTMFFSKEIICSYGSYNTKYKIKADYDLTVNTVVSGVTYKHIPVLICEYEGGGISEITKEVNEVEEKEIYDTYFSKKQKLIYEIILFFTFRRLRARLVSDSSPKWLRRLYRNFVNKVNGK